MEPTIDSTTFGYITIQGTTYEKDIIIRLNGEIKKRKKKLSKAIYGTSHKLSKEEAKHVYEKGAKKLIIGSGQQGVLTLTDEAVDYFQKKGCNIEIAPTPEAIQNWNRQKGQFIGLFHITC